MQEDTLVQAVRSEEAVVGVAEFPVGGDGIQAAPLPQREINEYKTPSAFVSTHWLHYMTSDHLLVLERCGIVKVDVQCDATEWQRQRILVTVKIPDFPKPAFRVRGSGLQLGLQVDHFTVFVTPAAIAQDWAPESLGWAVDGFGSLDMYTLPLSNMMTFYADIALRGRKRAHLLRLAYTLKVTGTYLVEHLDVN